MKRAPSDVLPDDDADGEDVKPAHAASPQPQTAWDIWRNLSTETGAVANQADRQRMIERHKLVVSIIELNSQQLRCESARSGVDIERAAALREASSAPSEDYQKIIAELDERAARLAAESQRLVEQRDFLNASLAEFDGSISGKNDRPVGRA